MKMDLQQKISPLIRFDMTIRTVITSGMSAQISAKASPCGALSLLSLDLTRGCRVQ